MRLGHGIERLARRYLFPAIERLWRWMLHAVRPILMRGPTVQRLTPGDGEIVVVVAPHPDDETVGAGGTLALHALAGATVKIVVVTDGGESQAGGLTHDEMVTRRKGELATAVKKLGVHEATYLGFPERQADTSLLRTKLSELLSAATVIYAPSCVDFHPDHLDVARTVADSVREGQIVRVYEVGVPLTPLLVNRVVDIGPVIQRKAAALACFDTQARNLEPLARLARYRKALYGLDAIEVFWELSPSAYRKVIRENSWTWEESPFRGIRSTPFSDPLAFLVGRRTRLRLSKAGETVPRSAAQRASVNSR